jgi:predicted kinase
VEAILLIGLQASGKTTFYQERFLRTHLRLNLDMLRTRRREGLLLEACLRAGQRFVVDNTNPTRAERARYIAPVRAARFRVVGYWLDFPAAEALARNAARPEGERVPEVAIWATLARLEPPARDEGFDALYRATPSADGTWAVAPWPAADAPSPQTP